MSRADVLVIAAEPLIPTVTGGRVRAAALVRELANPFDVAIIRPEDRKDTDTWDHRTHLNTDVKQIILPPIHRVSRARRLIDVKPHQGIGAIGGEAETLIDAAYQRLRPRVLFYTRSFLAAASPLFASMPWVVDFPDIQNIRFKQLGSIGSFRRRMRYAIESAKARSWEPRVASRSNLVIATIPKERDLLMRWGGRTIFIPNMFTRAPAGRSPIDGPITYLASTTYPPNVEAGRALIHNVWPRVRKSIPRACLRIVGRGSRDVFAWAQSLEGIDVVGDVEDVSKYFEETSLTVSPVFTVLAHNSKF